MAWQIDITKTAEKELQKIDKSSAQRIIKFLLELKNPRSTGKPLSDTLSKLWRYRIGNYRILAEIIDKKLLVLVVSVGHRQSVYKK